MPLPDGAYCAAADLRLGDLAYPSYLGTKETRILAAAEEIDIAIGKIYVTPVDFPDTIPPDESRPSYLTLKKANWLICSGRIILDMAAAGERENLHAYGHSMLKEGIGILLNIACGEIQLDIPRLEPGEGEVIFTGPAIDNEDPESLVSSFYKARDPFGEPVPTAYGHPRSFYG